MEAVKLEFLLFPFGNKTHNAAPHFAPSSIDLRKCIYHPAARRESTKIVYNVDAINIENSDRCNGRPTARSELLQSAIERNKATVDRSRVGGGIGESIS